MAYTAKRTASVDEAVEMIGELPADIYETTSSGQSGYLKSEEAADDLEEVSEDVRISVAYSDGKMYAVFRPKSSPLEPPRRGARTAFDLEGGFARFKQFLDGHDWK